MVASAELVGRINVTSGQGTSMKMFTSATVSLSRG